MRQAQALRVLMDGESVFLTGAPGAGKSYVLNKFVKLAERAGKKVAVTASTGIAATHIGGITIHSWSGIGIRDHLSGHDLDTLQARSVLVKRFNATDVLVIDEVSMLSGSFLDMLDEVCGHLRDNHDPFGGLQVVLVGDMFQLPPVNRGTQAIDFAHNSAAWAELAPRTCYLTEQHRQTDGGLLAVLEAMRAGELEEGHADILQSRMNVELPTDVAITRLYAHNADVDTINRKHLQAISEQSEYYEMTTKGPAAKVEQLARGLLAPASLELKVGAEVMFVANDFANGFANGSRGRVVALNGDWPEVQLVAKNRIVSVEPHTWQLVEDGKVRAEVSQLPLRLAWAITIHKSQGMSLDAAEIDLSKTFTPGMGYVALSRVRDLDGLYLRGMNAMALQLHPTIFEIDHTLRQASAELSHKTDDYVEAQVTNEQSGEARYQLDSVLLEKLKEWRSIRAEAEHVPAYIIAHNNLLEGIALQRPLTRQSLLSVKGMGQAKLEKFGEDLLSIVLQHLGQPVEATANITMDQERVVIPTSSWTAEEDELLSKHLLAMTPLNEVCQLLGRTPGAVWARVATLLYKQK